MILNNKLIILIILVCLIFLSTSCKDNKKSFTAAEYKVIDSLYKIRKKAIKTKLDSLCDSVYKAEYPKMVDSIKIIRKKEILDLIE